MEETETPEEEVEEGEWVAGLSSVQAGATAGTNKASSSGDETVAGAGAAK